MNLFLFHRANEHVFLLFIDQNEPVWRRHLVQIALLPVHKHRVRPPDLRERFPVERDLSDSARVELESRV